MKDLYGGRISLPLAAALGGMVFPFLIHYSINRGSLAAAGAGIPMATDIAFALGILSLARGVPYGVKVFLTAFAIIDDLGAIVVIAIFYTREIHTAYLLGVALVFGAMLILNKLRIMRLWPYLLLGAACWYCLLQSGVHATISGVLLAFVLPFQGGAEGAPSHRVQHALHKPVAFLVLPLFALVNTGILIGNEWIADLQTPNSIGIIAGLVAGKPIGILLCATLFVQCGWAMLPAGVKWGQLAGAAILGGIGFTMSIFITLLAFDDPGMIRQSKLAIFAASLLASLLGLAMISFANRNSPQGVDAT